MIRVPATDPPESTAGSITNLAQTQLAYAGLEGLVKRAMVRDWSGTVALEIAVKGGTVLTVESVERRRHTRQVEAGRPAA